MLNSLFLTPLLFQPAMSSVLVGVTVARLHIVAPVLDLAWPPLCLGPVPHPAMFTERKLSPAALR